MRHYRREIHLKADFAFIELLFGNGFCDAYNVALMIIVIVSCYIHLTIRCNHHFLGLIGLRTFPKVAILSK